MKERAMKNLLMSAAVAVPFLFGSPVSAQTVDCFAIYHDSSVNSGPLLELRKGNVTVYVSENIRVRVDPTATVNRVVVKAATTDAVILDFGGCTSPVHITNMMDDLTDWQRDWIKRTAAF